MTENPNVRLFDMLMVRRHQARWVENAIAAESVAVMRRGISGLRGQFFEEWYVNRPDRKAPVDRELVDSVVGLVSVWVAGRANEAAGILRARLEQQAYAEFQTWVRMLHPVVDDILREQREQDLIRSAAQSGVEISVPAETMAEVVADPLIYIETQRDDAIIRARRGLIRSMIAGEGATVAWGRVREGTERAAIGMETIARYELESALNGIDRQITEAFKELIPTEQYVATLDERCCIECASYDGEIYKVGEGPEPPIHPRCHCFRTPMVKDFASPGEEAEREAWFGKPDSLYPARRGELISVPGKERRVRAKSAGPWRVPGQWEVKKIPAKVHYDTWFKRQPASVQKVILGPSRYGLWRGDKFSVKKFVSKGRITPLDELVLS